MTTRQHEQQHWQNLTRTELYSRHWYKELYTSAQRRARYALARKCGADRCLALRIRDMSPKHAESMLLNFIAQRERIYSSSREPVPVIQALTNS